MEIKGGRDIDDIPAPPPTAEDEGLISSNPPWGWQEAMVALGGMLCIIAAVALPWAKVNLNWDDVVFGFEAELYTYSFKLLENPWLTAAVITVAVVCIAGLFLRRHAGKVSVVASVLLLAFSTAYIISLIIEAYDWLGLKEGVLDALGELPFVGPWLEVWVEESLKISALPHAGLFLFYAGAFVILAGGIIIWNRNNRWANQGI
jgi:hypothetical protein